MFDISSLWFSISQSFELGWSQLTSADSWDVNSPVENNWIGEWDVQTYSPVIKRGNGKSTFNGGVGGKVILSINGGFSIATFDYRKVIVVAKVRFSPAIVGKVWHHAVNWRLVLSHVPPGTDDKNAPQISSSFCKAIIKRDNYLWRYGKISKCSYIYIYIFSGFHEK